MTTRTTGHTPGPWTCHSGMVWKDGPNVYPKGNEDGIPIASMCREPGNGTLPVERDANARLIASAPELLEVAQLVRGFFEETAGKHTAVIYGEGGKALLDKARAVIAKAEKVTP